MNTNDPGREPTDAELLRDMMASRAAMTKIGMRAEDPQDWEEYCAEYEAESLRGRAAHLAADRRGMEYLSGARPMPDTKLCGAVTQAGEDRKFRTCEWAEDMDGNWDTSCNKVFVFLNYDGPEGNGFKFCPYCGGQLAEVPHEEAQDEEGE